MLSLRSMAKVQGLLTCHSLTLVQLWGYSAPGLVDGKAVCPVMHREADPNLLNLNLRNCCRCHLCHCCQPCRCQPGHCQPCRCQPCHRCHRCWLELAKT